MTEAYCLSCGHIQKITKENTFYDELGKHTVCEQCESSYDLIDEHIAKANS